MVCNANLFIFTNISKSTIMKIQADQNIFDEKQSLKVIQSTIETSKRVLKDDGILLICWGIALSISNSWHYYESVVLTVWWMRNLMKVAQIVLGIGVIGITVYYIFFRKKKATTFTAISTRYVWIGVIIAHNMIVMITKSILSDVNFVLLQPLQMVLIGFALFVTGGIYRYYILAVSGLIMWGAAVWCAHFELNIQFLIRAIAEVICFIVPGILMYSSRKK